MGAGGAAFLIGISSDDFRFTYEVAVRLRRLGAKFREVPSNIKGYGGVNILIKHGPSRLILDGSHVILYGEPEEASMKAWLLDRGLQVRDGIVFLGIDPGVRPGIAVLSRGQVIATAVASSPERVNYYSSILSSLVGRERVHARVGRGDPTNRDRIIRAIWKNCSIVEIVDEDRTSRGNGSHEQAASLIALARGSRITRPPTPHPSEGEVREIQRRSRLRSGGLTTISREMAISVARGESTMEDAIREHMREARLKRGAN
ncbi:MAG: hypothetical protein QXP70_00515 [Methanomassiliicoccales archaeon]